MTREEKLMKDRKILRTRSGAPLRLMALLEEAEANARREIDASRPELPEDVRAAIAPMIRRPMPGIENTCSMITVPPSSAPATMPITVRIGLKAFGSP